MGILIWLLMLAVQAIVAVELTQRLGITWGLGLFACLIGATVGLAGYLLYYSTTGEINWRNRIAGLFLPWSLLVGQGSLTSLLLKNLFASLAWGGVMVVAERMSWLWPQASNSATSPTASIMIARWLTLLCQLALLAGWLLLLRSTFTRRSGQIAFKSIWQPALLAPLAILASLILGHYGYNWLALLAVGLPLFIVLSPLLLMLAAMAYMTLTGKKIRWN